MATHVTLGIKGKQAFQKGIHRRIEDFKSTPNKKISYQKRSKI